MAAAPRLIASRIELDELTLARARRGEAAACRALAAMYQGPVFAFLWRMGAGGQTEDLTQETFLRVFRALPRFSSDGSARLSTWILTIAARVAVKQLRRRRWWFFSLGERAYQVPDDDARADEGAERRALGATLARAIARLSAEQRAVFLLRDYHELEYQEIAVALGIDLGTVKSRLSRARASLRVTLKDLKGDPE